MDAVLERLRVPTREEIEAERALRRKRGTSVRFEPKLKADLIAYAARKDMSFNSLVEHLCRQGLAAVRHLEAESPNGRKKK